MSIYATLWHLQFPRHGDAYVGCEWVDVFAQGVPAHVGTPTPGYGCESGDPYESFLPPALRIDGELSEDHLRAVVFVAGVSGKGTARSGQEYESPLLVLTGIEYAEMPFQVLHDRLCSALRGAEPRLVLEMFRPDGIAMLVFEDGSTTPVAVDNASTTMGVALGQSGHAGSCAHESVSTGIDISVPNLYLQEMDTVPLKPERLAQLEEFARRRGKSTADALDDALADYLEWERQDYQEALEGIRQGHEDVMAGRSAPADQFFDEFARKHGLPR